LHCSADIVGVICTAQQILLALFALFSRYCWRYLHCSADIVGVICTVKLILLVLLQKTPRREKYGAKNGHGTQTELG
jgi:hypothetical protein